MKTTFPIRVRRDGVITLPKELRDRTGIESGMRLTLHDLGDGLIIMSPIRSHVDQVADQLAQEWRAAGISLDSLLTSLRQVRKDRDTTQR